MLLITIGLLGLCFGSFINALVWRLMEQAKPKNNRLNVNLSVSKGRSVCTSCKHRLVWRDLIPVISWLTLMGKCRYCKKRIHWQYPAVELLTSALFVASFIFWPLSLASFVAWVKFAIWLAIVVVLVALAVYDLKTMLLPDRLVAWLAGFVAADLILKQLNGFNAAVILSAAVGLAAYGGLFYIIFQVSKGRWIGGGDVKLGFVLGAYLANWQLSLLTIFLASLIGTLVLFALLPLGKAKLKMQLPFGPMLIASTIIAVLFGQDILSWYFGLLYIL